VTLGEPLHGTMRFVAPATVWQAHMEVETTLGHAALDLNLCPLHDAPSGWDNALEGSFGGLVIRLLLRGTKTGGELSMTWQYTMGEAPVEHQRDALRFLRALHGKGILWTRDRQAEHARLPLDLDGHDLSPEIEGVIALLEDLVIIQHASGQTFELPDEVDAEEAHAIAFAAKWIRDRALPVTWDNFTATVPPENLAAFASGDEIRIEENAFMRLFDQEVFLGKRILVLRDARITATEATADSPKAKVRVTLEPVSDAARHVQMILEPAHEVRE
jgi:hypothetical protein